MKQNQKGDPLGGAACKLLSGGVQITQRKASSPRPKSALDLFMLEIKISISKHRNLTIIQLEKSQELKETVEKANCFEKNSAF